MTQFDPNFPKFDCIAITKLMEKTNKILSKMTKQQQTKMILMDFKPKIIKNLRLRRERVRRKMNPVTKIPSFQLIQKLQILTCFQFSTQNTKVEGQFKSHNNTATQTLKQISQQIPITTIMRCLPVMKTNAKT